MTIRNLDLMFAPRSVAVIGASDRAASVGATVWKNLRHGAFTGSCWAVNPGRSAIGADPVYPNIASLPAAPDLAVVCTPAASIPALIQQLGARGTRAVVVLSAGVDAELRQAMLDAARPYLLRIIGPNCLGVLSPHAGLNASFSHTDAEPGTLAFVSQSGALVTAVLDWARERGIGFSHCISLGEHADVDFGDLLDWLASDPHTRAILLYVESVTSARKFMTAARAAARNKPVLLVKAGRSPSGQAAAASHTGALAGSDLVYDDAIRRAGMLRVDTLEELFIAAETLAHFRHAPSDVEASRLERLTLVTNGGGAGVMAADAAAAAGIALAPLGDETRRALDAALPAAWSRSNPVDIIGDAPVSRYLSTLQLLLDDRDSGTLLFMHAPTAIVPSSEIAQALVPLLQPVAQRVMACWLGGQGVKAARQRFQEAGIRCYDTPEEAVRAFSMLATYRRNQQLLLQTPALHVAPQNADFAPVRAIVDDALADGRTMLNEPEAKALLAAAGVPVVATRIVAPGAAPAVAAARSIGYPVALKVLSPQISHKSDVGGVALNLEDAAAVCQAVADITHRVASLRPDAQLAGFTVQAMVRRPNAIELIIGASVDPLFGPVILFGQGGTAVEILADRALALPPLNGPLARALIDRTRVARLLQGWRDVPPADLDALVSVLQAVSDLLAAEPRIAEIDINPLLCNADGAIGLDARVRVDATGPGGVEHFAILPYPARLAQSWAWNGRTVTVRPIRPEDEAAHRRFLERLEPADIYMRTFSSRRSIEHGELARLTQIDYGREMAFIVTAEPPDDETLAVVRAVCDPDNMDAEFGILVRSDLKGEGLGARLMHKLIDYLRSQGTQRLVSTVLTDNERMLNLARRLGFSVERSTDEPDLRHISLDLQAPLARSEIGRTVSA